MSRVLKFDSYFRLNEENAVFDKAGIAKRIKEETGLQDKDIALSLANLINGKTRANLTSNDIKLLQFLIFDDKSQIDGLYGKQTISQLKKIQEGKLGLTGKDVDGIWGPNTAAGFLDKAITAFTLKEYGKQFGVKIPDNFDPRKLGANKNTGTNSSTSNNTSTNTTTNSEVTKKSSEFINNIAKNIIVAISGLSEDEDAIYREFGEIETKKDFEELENLWNSFVTQPLLDKTSWTDSTTIDQLKKYDVNKKNKIITLRNTIAKYLNRSEINYINNRLPKDVEKFEL
jgi:hypothetical protein